ncbi:MAG: hypothetical protein JKY52_13445 [Flavobacteriales bacterium]|nr:hypothetical protein [Flavobacteriales bacterium]
MPRLKILALFLIICPICKSQTIQKKNIAKVGYSERPIYKEADQSMEFIIFLKSDTIVFLSVAPDELGAHWLNQTQSPKKTFNEFLKDYNKKYKLGYDVYEDILTAYGKNQDSIYSRSHKYTYQDSLVTVQWELKYKLTTDSIFTRHSKKNQSYFESYAILNKW